MYRVLFRSFLKINFHYESDRRYFIFQHQSAWNENWNRFFLLEERKWGGGLINVIVSSVDNSNLPVVCRYCRLINSFYQCRDLLVYTSVFATWFSKNCPHITSASGLILADAKLHAQVHSFRLSHMTSSLLEDSSRNESDFKDTDQR